MTLAKKLNNWDKDATGGGLWASTTTFTATVPANKRWFFLGGMVNRAISSTVVIYMRDASGEQIIRLLDEAAGTGLNVYPEDTFKTGKMLILDPGEDIHMVFGTAQDANAWADCPVLEIDI